MNYNDRMATDSFAVTRRNFVAAAGASALLTMPGLSGPDDLAPILHLAARVCPNRWQEFIFEKLDAGETETFEISTHRGRPRIRASSIPAMATGLNTYLRELCLQQVSWTQHQATLPRKLPAVTGTIRRQTFCRYRYHFNYCTFSYSSAFWTWPQWERQLDWMALNGINLALAAVIGQECVWQSVLTQLGVHEKDIAGFIPGPAFEPWWLMDNLEGWGGPAWKNWIAGRGTLQNQILRRMKELGIAPVLQGFFGMVPRKLKHYFPNAHIVDTGIWANTFTRPPMLMPDDPLFDRLAALWYQTQEHLFGPSIYFGGDPFHEGSVPHGTNLARTGAGIQAAMLKANPHAIWVLQGWDANPRPAMLQATRPAHTLVLDLFCDGPDGGAYQKRHNWSGHPWIWAVINNFGGNIGLFGQWRNIANGPAAARHSGRMCGIGAMMEAQVDYPNFQLLFDTAWNTHSIDLAKWTRQYADQRYGRADHDAQAAWLLLKESVYNSKTDHRYVSVFCLQPDAGIVLPQQYDPMLLIEAWEKLLAAAPRLESSENYRFDLTDITRQVLANLAYWQFRRAVGRLHAGQAGTFAAAAKTFLAMLADQDALLATQPDFMLGDWIASARRLGVTGAQKDLLEQNARRLITTWGPKPGIADYACREWAGLLSDFYASRWKLWIRQQKDRLAGKKIRAIPWFRLEQAWTQKRNHFAAMPTGDSVTAAKRIKSKYAPLLQAAFGHKT